MRELMPLYSTEMENERSLCDSYIHACLTPGRYITFKTEKENTLDHNSNWTSPDLVFAHLC